MKKKILLSLLLVVAVVSITGCGGKKEESKKKNGNSREVDNYNSAFFIKEGSNYALFSDSGKKLTDFEFTYAGKFVNGAALVKNDKASGVINTDGKMVIDFGKYKYVYQEAGLYKVTDEERNEYLLNAKGKKVADLKDATLNTFIGEGKYSILFDKSKEEYKVLDVDGNAMVTFKGTSEDKPTTNSEKNFLSVYGNGKTYIIDLITGKKVTEIEADKHYCVNNATDDGKIITLNSCVGMFQKQDETSYKFIKDGKVYDLSDKCDKVYLNTGNLMCVKDNKNYLLDSKLNVGISTDGVYYADSEHFAKAKSGSFNGIDFYEKDTVVKNVECRTMHDYGYSKSGLYILNTYFSKPCGTDSGTYEYYNTKGEKQFNKSFASAQKFDDNNLARVSEDRKNYYLIDIKGNKVSEDYDGINSRYSYYVVTKDKVEGIIDNKGKVVVDVKYNKIDVFDVYDVTYAVLTTADSKYVVYNLDSKKEVATFDTAPVVSSDDYMTVTKDGKKVYYTYTGKEFYSEK